MNLHQINFVNILFCNLKIDLFLVCGPVKNFQEQKCCFDRLFIYLISYNLAIFFSKDFVVENICFLEFSWKKNLFHKKKKNCLKYKINIELTF